MLCAAMENTHRPSRLAKSDTPVDWATDPNTQRLLNDLSARYGERLPDVLEADMLRREITYDDYIETPTLLSLQQTLTDYHDELIFKVYHQQTELWFRLILHEINRAIRSMNAESLDLPVATESVQRINRYFAVLAHSYCVMLDGLSVEEFLVYRKAFGTSSGFQSAQFRAIEILAGMEKDPAHQGEFYWERAARHITTGEPAMTLIRFKEEHLHHLNKLYAGRAPHSLRISFMNAATGAAPDPDRVSIMAEALSGAKGAEIATLGEELLKMDDAIVEWKLQHLKVAAKHLKRAPKGTGETNWAEYLSKSMKEQRCFPELQAAKGRVAS